MTSRPVGPALALASLLLVSLFVAMPAAADHPQRVRDDGSSWVRFDHSAGNEWWVEVNVTSSEPIGEVLARREGGSWQRLTLREWGNWAANFRVPPGERVQFQAYQAGGMSDVWRRTSCFFTHPAGAEQCDPGATENLIVRVREPSGNEWWQQVFLDSNRPLTHAWVGKYTVDGWSGQALTKRTWGGWATSLHAPSGTLIMFMAFDGAETRKSACYRWPDAAIVDCPPESTPGGPLPHMTSFDHKTGNEWWVEVLVGPVDATRVQAQDDGGTWVELTHRDWGAWAASFRIEPGHRVHFRALVQDQWFDSCWFTHPQGMTPDGYQVCRNVQNPP